MPRSSYSQSNFLGGEWAPQAQGRSEDPRYATALSRCFNALPVEEGAWIRRSGTQRLGPTYKQAQARILPFVSSTSCAFVCEFTDGNLQFWSGPAPIFTNDPRTVSAASLNFAGILTLTLDAAHGWTVGDTVMFSFPAGYSQTLESNCRGRVFQAISGTTGSTLVLGDILGNGLPITLPSGGLVGATVLRIKRFAAPWHAADLAGLRIVQAQNNAVILSAGLPPYTLTVQEPTGNNDPTFSLASTDFADGPYLDPSGDTCTVSGFTGTITVTASTTTPFSSTDLGRHIRLFSQPPAWNAGTPYVTGNLVTGPDGVSWWQAIANNTGVTPGTMTVVNGVNTVVWVPSANAGSWAWGKIASYVSPSQVTVTLDTSIPGMVLNSANGTTMSLFRLGVYTSAQYPTVGTYHEGRLWLAGAVPNRFDSSISNLRAPTDPVTRFVFSPTDPNGNVLDSSGISETLNSTELNTFQWMLPDDRGIVCGTLGGEWIIEASALSDPLTPTSIQAHQTTKYGSKFVEARRAGMAIIFVQRFGRRVIEYLADAFTGRFSGSHLNEMSKHLSISGVVELAYQEESAPVIWARMADGSLAGCTYRRVSRFVTEKPVFSGWHKHQHGSPRATFEGMCILPREDGLSDALYLVVNDGLQRYIEIMRPLFEPAKDTIRNAWHIDAAPGNAVATSLVKCGFYVPSIGISGTGSVAADWPNASIDNLPGRATIAPGTTLTAANQGLAFGVLKDGVKFNGYSLLYNLGFSTLETAFSLSCWIYTEGQSGVLVGTPMQLFGTFWTGYEISQILGITDLSKLLAIGGTYNGIGGPGTGGNAILGSNGPTPGGGAWHHLMLSIDLLLGKVSIYMDNTDLSRLGLPYNNGFDLSKLAVGGQEFISLPTSSSAPELISTTQIPNGNGLIAAMAELWITNTYVDWTNAANRAKFHISDLSGLNFAPCDLGNRGQLPFGTQPKVYLAGNPSQFRFNRARRMQIGTYNGFLDTNEIDPRETTLDPSDVGVPSL